MKELLSNLLLIAISLFGLSYMVFGKPRKYYEEFTNFTGEKIYVKRDNFTRKIMYFIIAIIVINLLMSS